MNEVEQLRQEALSEKLRLLKDAGVSIGENALAYGSGAATSAVAGLRGLGEFFAPDSSSWDRRKERAAGAVEKTQEQLSPYVYQPQADVSQRGQQNLSDVFERVGTDVNDMYLNPIAEKGGIGPEVATAAVIAGNLIGPKGKPKATPKPKPRFDPGSFQQLIPGIEPLSLDQAHARARGELMRAQDAMSFDDLNSGLRFEYDPNWRGGGATYEVNYRDAPEGSNEGKRPVGRLTQRPVPLAQLEEVSTRTVPQGEFASPNTVQAEVGPENFQRMMALTERLRAAEDETYHIGDQALQSRARDLNERIARHRALLEEPGINAEQRLQLEEELLRLQRQRPIDVGGRILEPLPVDEGQFSNLRWHDVWGAERTPEAQAHLREYPGVLDAQTRLVRRLRGEPEITYTPRRSVHGSALPDTEGRDPNAMNREAVNQFLAGGRSNPELFQYGVMPGPGVRSLEDFARHFGREAGEPISVDFSYADNDEPSKIKVAKEHGRGEEMRDAYGDPKMDEKSHERGDYPMYDERGDVKMVETPGPLPKGEEGPLLKKERAEGGEPKRDSYGDTQYEYRLSEGGEPVRDERGRVKEEWQDNPDYSGSEVDQATLSSPYGHIDIRYDDPAYITATEAGKKGGSLLYQTALAHASRAGIDIGGGSLTDINAYRLLSNVLSNIARTGTNPRDLAGTSSGRASRARGQAEGPEVWRAEAEEGRERLLARGIDADRVKFDPEKGFSIDGKPASPDDIKLNLGELSPNAGARGSYGGVGQKSLMRNAVFGWLRHATPEEAARVAAKWPKAWGPIFAGIGALAVGAGALQQQEPQMAE